MNAPVPAAGFRPARLPDIGLAELNPEIDVDFSFLDGITDVREASDDDVAKHTVVSMTGYRSGKKSGTIVHVKAEAPLKYADRVLTLGNLIVIANRINGQYQTISMRGDSGSLVTDGKYAIGIVVGGNSQFTYAMSLPFILKNTQLKVYKP